MTQEEAKVTAILNDKIMKLNEERLQLCLEIIEMSGQKFWK